jgi:hypothetical protein
VSKVNSLVFGIPTHKGILRSFVVLDKSFLQAISRAQLQFYVNQGWAIGIPRVLWDEHFRKWDKRRFANLKKLRSVEKSLVLLPGISEMLNAECKHRKPASVVLRCKQVEFKSHWFNDGAGTPELDLNTRATAEIVDQRLERRLNQIVPIWRDFKKLPGFENAKSEDMPDIVRRKRKQIRDDREDMRAFYATHRHDIAPPAELIDEKWAHFRWIQVQLLAGLDFFASYGLGAPFRKEDMFHELLDLDYLIPAILVGGLASREVRMIQRFRLLRPDGVVLK